MMLKLQKSIIYGPVNSRRLGRSLGINILPISYKICSFNCLYCQYGWTSQWTSNVNHFIKDLPSVENTLSEVEQALAGDLDFEYLTFSGNGEPTMHPEFDTLVREIKKLCLQYRPRLKLALLSNSSGLLHDSVFNAVSEIHVPILKLDAGTEETFFKINHPASGIDFREIINQMKKLSYFFIQTALFSGEPTNTSPTELDAYYGLVNEIHPEKVHIYSIERSYPHKGIHVVSGNELEQIAQRGQEISGVKFSAFYN